MEGESYTFDVQGAHRGSQEGLKGLFSRLCRRRTVSPPPHVVLSWSARSAAPLQPCFYKHIISSEFRLYVSQKREDMANRLGLYLSDLPSLAGKQ